LDSTPIIYATEEPEAVQQVQKTLGAEQAGELIESALATLAVAARDKGRYKVVVAGGESSGAVTQALGINKLRIGKEIAPGVPWCYADTNGQSMAVALKSGNFGSPDFFTDALKGL